MIRECNESELKNLMKVYPDAIFYRVCRKPIFVKGIKNGFVLAPGKELHGSYQAQKIEWEEYAPQYIVDIAMSEKAQMLISKIWSLRGMERSRNGGANNVFSN